VIDYFVVDMSEVQSTTFVHVFMLAQDALYVTPRRIHDERDSPKTEGIRPTTMHGANTPPGPEI
jgi:hypothetical protein